MWKHNQIHKDQGAVQAEAQEAQTTPKKEFSAAPPVASQQQQGAGEAGQRAQGVDHRDHATSPW
jgi:hypothetical protein